MIVENFIDKLRRDFYAALEEKTGWGRNQVKQVFEQALLGAALSIAPSSEETKATEEIKAAFAEGPLGKTPVDDSSVEPW